MDPGRWNQLRELFDAALNLAASERPAFIAQSCEGDPDLHSTLKSLLEHSHETGSTFDQALIATVNLEDSIPTRLDLQGHILGHYRILEKIGEGGMGEVYRATDTHLGREVAIKILPEVFSRDLERMARFEREAQVLASLNHPYIATIHGIEESDGTRYLVLELVEGETLRSRLGRGLLPTKTVVRLAAQISEGLAKAHEAGIVHRDLKPDNLMLTEDGFIKILDFGLAKAAVGLNKGDSVMPTEPDLHTRPGRIMGTSNYMSPEQARGDEIDHRSDQFTFGSVLYEMATGVRAFGGETDADTRVAVMRREPERSEDFEAQVPAPLRRIISRCLAKDRMDRYESTRDLAIDLRKLKERIWEIDAPAATVARRSPTKKRKWQMVGAALIGLALVATAAAWRQSKDGTGDETGAPTEITALAGLTAPNRRDLPRDSGSRTRAAPRESSSIAVLPLENLGPAQEEYFADGMTDALIIHLSKIEALKVISRRSVMRYKGSQKSLPEIARELDVETVLTGSVLRAGDRVRISTQLTEADTDRNLWAESYEKNHRDILALQSVVARAIARAVRVEIDPSEEARISSWRKLEPEAHEAYLRGLADVAEAGLSRPDFRDSIRAGLEHFKRAIEIEPEWAEPHAELAHAYQWLAAVGGVAEQAKSYPRAKAAALRALELDDSVAEAHSVLARVLANHEWDWAAAEQAFRRAVELEPSLWSRGSGRFLLLQGRYEEAIDSFERRQVRYPTNLIVRYQLGQAYMCAGRLDEAEAEASRMIVDAPDSTDGRRLLAATRLRSARYEEAIAVLEEIGDDLAHNAWEVEMIPYAMAKAGDLERARESLGDLEAKGFDWFPALYMALGQEDKAMAQIEAAFAVRRDILLHIQCSLEYESLMEIPRFREIVEAIEFPA